MKNKDWKKVKLGEVCEIVSGSTPKRNNVEYWEEGIIPWVTPKDLSKLNTRFLEDIPEYITELGYRSCSTTLLPTNSLLFSSRAPIGHIAINKEPVCTNQGFKSFVPKTMLDVHYLYYTMYFFKEQVQALGTGSTFKEVSKRVISDFQIPLPPLAEQKAIAAQLDRADKVRQALAQSLADYDRLLAASFLDMFGDPVLNPKGWEVVKMSATCKKVLGGGTPSKSNQDFYEGDIPWVTPKDMKVKNIKISIDTITEEAISNSSVKLIPPKSLLMVMRSGILKKKLPLAINQVEVTINQDMKAFILKKDMVELQYIFYCFHLGQQKLLGKVRSVTADNLSFRDIKNFPIPLPPLSLQQQFAQLVERIERQKALIQSAQQSAEDLFGALLQAYFYEGKIG
ncbi:restriction endonuclease S subunit [Saprospira grandis DSM 2844]|uniref:Restriction endonuclease S subunit n=1 Tax=Saprospira grandis DSM 2844 TaxID=694433 RepID=J1HZP6_9BACT|nr:restriction endonuclease subunit S [Saprospira grandis]EJF51860.1 restriction endonuclease S subunit [Saprospira grandis DSM 2844]